ncbi:oxysterol-binding protein 2-like isoform X1 [Oncorhynchus nerka]|uniref:oxysterol-binding protein 2-like isoform X1 n=1 Tax=Oncorhynchus nerka TaxID=8023 RepID=UPI0011315127|nr:oxysterol-binding protein 2-like isoform X1 [Oncorhynchus nerka]XP_029530697.1 oxysterol-binding protein 2-like isoform X1 [Oncorhynchus nerka]
MTSSMLSTILMECSHPSVCTLFSRSSISLPLPGCAHHPAHHGGQRLQEKGTIHAIFEKCNNHYTWKKVTTTVHNIIVGKLWIDQSGDIDVVNQETGDRCHLKFAPYSYFSRDVARKVMDKDGKAHYVLPGTWDEKMEFSRVMQSSKGENGTEGQQKTVYQTLKARELWWKNPLP